MGIADQMILLPLCTNVWKMSYMYDRQILPAGWPLLDGIKILNKGKYIIDEMGDDAACPGFSSRLTFKARCNHTHSRVRIKVKRLGNLKFARFFRLGKRVLVALVLSAYLSVSLFSHLYRTQCISDQHVAPLDHRQADHVQAGIVEANKLQRARLRFPPVSTR